MQLYFNYIIIWQINYKTHQDFIDAISGRLHITKFHLTTSRLSPSHSHGGKNKYKLRKLFFGTRKRTQSRKREIVAWSVWRRAVTSAADDRLTHNFRSEARRIHRSNTLELEEARPNISGILLLLCSVLSEFYILYLQLSL